MNAHEIEVLLNTIALVALSIMMVPRLLFYMELRRLNDATTRYLGTTACLPRPVVSKQHMLSASRSVQKALAKRVRDFRWNIKVLEQRDNIQPTVRIEGFMPVDKLAELNESQARTTDKQLDIKITVDIYQHKNGSEIVWKYMPNDPSEFQRRQQIFDPAINFVLSNTNFQLLKELGQRA